MKRKIKMSKFLITNNLHEVIAYMKRNKIKHYPITKLIHGGKYKHLCEIKDPENLTSIMIGMNGAIEVPNKDEKYYRPGTVNLYE